MDKRIPKAFQAELGFTIARCWEIYGHYGWALEVSMDEILDGRGLGLDIILRSTNQGVMWEKPGFKPYFRLVANVHGSKGGPAVWFADQQEVLADVARWRLASA